MTSSNIKTHGTSIISIALITIIAIITTLPMMRDCRLGGHDIIYHQIYSHVYAEQFWNGDLYPRWIQSMNAGFGSPTFFYYAPLPYLFTSLLAPLVDNFGRTCSSLSLGSTVALTASGIAAWYWLKTQLRPTGALIGAIVYILLPYHLSIDLYRRVAYAEFWSFVWFPLALAFAEPALRGSRRAMVASAGFLACLVLTHLPSFIIFFPLYVGYSLVQASATPLQSKLARLAWTVILASGLSGVYWFPALTTQEWVSMDAIKSGFFDYRNNFLFEGPLIGGEQLRQFWKLIERSTLSSIVLATVAWAISRVKPHSADTRTANYFMVAALLSLLLMLPLSKPLWPFLLPLQRIQFPWRINIVVVSSATFLVGFAIDSITANSLVVSNQSRRPMTWSIAFLASLFVLFIVELGILRSSLWHGEGEQLVRLLRISAASICIGLLPLLLRRSSLVSGGMGLVLAFWIILIFTVTDQDYKSIMSTRTNYGKNDFANLQAAAEHRPRWVSEKQFSDSTVSQWSADTPTIRFLDNNGRAEVLYWRPRSIRFEIHAPSPSRIQVRQFYFPGWSAQIGPSKRSLPTRPSASGLLEVTIPSGHYQIDITLDASVNERIGQLMTMLSMVACFLIITPISRLKLRIISVRRLLR